MCPKREWFSSYMPYDEVSVLIGKNVVCKTVRIGNIHIRMLTGSNPHERTTRSGFEEESSLVGSFLKLEDTSF